MTIMQKKCCLEDKTNKITNKIKTTLKGLVTDSRRIAELPNKRWPKEPLARLYVDTENINPFDSKPA